MVTGKVGSTERSTRKLALIAGATGVVGRNLLRHFVALPDWDVVAVSRRVPDIEGDYRHVSVDLLDPADCAAKLGDYSAVTHVFFAAYVEKPSWAALVPPNVAMLRNLLDVIEPVASGLAHVHLMEGTKWYGSHLGPFKTPAKEDDPRHMPPNFYYDQQDHLVDRQQDKAWSWSAARPHGVCGFAIGNPMNLVMVIAVYASVSKALGLPLRHPGSAANAQALYQSTDVDLLAQSVAWMATEPDCANQAFNVTNGDLYRWEDQWPVFAEYFDMPLAAPQKINLVGMMADKGDLWATLVSRYNLQRIAYDKLVSWGYGDFVFTPEYDIASSMTKARRFGFHPVVDSTEMFLRQFDELRANRVIPPG